MKNFLLALPISLMMVGCTDIDVGNYVLFPTEDTEYQKEQTKIFEAKESAKMLKKYNSLVEQKKLYISTIDKCITETKSGISKITVSESLEIKNSCEVYSANTNGMSFKNLSNINDQIHRYEMTGILY